MLTRLRACGVLRRGPLLTGRTGSGESGKSTIVKQMKIIHANGYTNTELMAFRLPVIKNLIDSANALVTALRLLDVEPREPTNKARRPPTPRRPLTRRRPPSRSSRSSS